MTVTKFEKQLEMHASVQRVNVRHPDPPDLQLFHQDRYRHSFVCILFPSIDKETVDFIKSLNKVPEWLLIEDRLMLADEAAARQPTFEQRFNQLRANFKGEGALELRQRVFPLKYMPEVLWHCQGRREHYLGQNSYASWQRASDNVKQLTSCWLDLDFYKLQNEEIRKALDCDDSAVDIIINHCTEGIHDRSFLPTQIIRSGRGIYVKWIFSHFLPSVAAPRWRRCMDALVERFKDLGADPASKDAARILRVTGSRNSKSKTLVRVLKTGETIMFDDLAAAVLPLQRASVADRLATKTLAENVRKRFGRKVEKDKSSQSDRSFSWPALVAGEIKTLAMMRVLRGQEARGHMETMTFIHINFQLMAGLIVDRADFDRQVIEFGVLIQADNKLLAGKVLNLWSRQSAGRQMYRFKKQTVIDRLKITDEELMQLRCLARSQGRELRKPTAQTRVELAENQQRALLLERAGMQLKQIASQLNISTKTVKRWLVAAR